MVKTEQTIPEPRKTSFSRHLEFKPLSIGGPSMYATFIANTIHKAARGINKKWTIIREKEMDTSVSTLLRNKKRINGLTVFLLFVTRWSLFTTKHLRKDEGEERGCKDISKRRDGSFMQGPIVNQSPWLGSYHDLPSPTRKRPTGKGESDQKRKDEATTINIVFVAVLATTSCQLASGIASKYRATIKTLRVIVTNPFKASSFTLPEILFFSLFVLFSPLPFGFHF